MIRTDRWKYIYVDNHRPQLFDLENDPDELEDLGDSAEYSAIITQMQQHLIQFLVRRKHRITRTEQEIADIVKPPNRELRGIYIGYYDEDALPDAVKAKLRGDGA